MQKNHLLIVVVAAVAAVAVAATILVLFLAPSCTPGPPYMIESYRRPFEFTASEYVVLDSDDLEEFPLIGDVIDAFDNPEVHPDATFTHGTLHYDVYDEMELDRTDDFLCDEFQSQNPPQTSGYCPGGYILACDKNDGNGLQFYSWEVIAIDYGAPIICVP